MGGGGGENTENSSMTHEDDREDYSVVQARTPLTGFVLRRPWNKPSPVHLCGGKRSVMDPVSPSLLPARRSQPLLFGE